MSEAADIVEVECKNEDIEEINCTENKVEQGKVAKISDDKPSGLNVDDWLEPIHPSSNIIEVRQPSSPLKERKVVLEESPPCKSNTTKDCLQDNVGSNSGANRKRKSEPLPANIVSNLVNNKNDRLAKTVKVFQETGLLRCTIETAKLLRETERMQESLDKLEQDVTKACKKTRLDIDEHVSKLTKISSAMDELTSKPCLPKN